MRRLIEEEKEEEGNGRRRGERARMGDYSVGREEGGLEIPFEEVPFNWFKRVEGWESQMWKSSTV